MADSTIAALTALAALDGNELLYVVDDPAGTPLDRKVTTNQLRAGLLMPSPVDMNAAYYIGPPLGSSVSASAQAANIIFAHLFYVPDDRTITEIGIDVTVAGAGSARLGIYNCRSTEDVMPGTLVSDAGTVSVNVTNTFQKLTGLSIPIKRGWYNAVSVMDIACTAFRLATGSLGWNPFGSGVSGIISWQRAFTYAALPADESAQVYSSGTSTAVFLK